MINSLHNCTILLVVMKSINHIFAHDEQFLLRLYFKIQPQFFLVAIKH